MRKFYRDYSLVGVVLVFSSLLLGLTFRIFNIEAVSAWGDEVASLYYAKHIKNVFLYESHTPFYYLICKAWMGIFPDTIVSLRYLFIFLSTALMSLICYLLAKKRGIGTAFIFLILWWLWPTDITFSRQARHYSLYAEMTFLFLIVWDLKKDFSKKILYLLSMSFQLIHPFALFPVWYLALYDWARKRSTLRETFFYLSTSLPLIIYYGARFLIYGRQRVFSNIGWVSENFGAFQKSLFLLFVGDSFPLTKVYPLSLGVGLIFLFLIVAVFLFKKNFISKIYSNEKLLKFLQIFLITIITAEVFSYFFTNVKISRYFIFLIPFFLYALLEWVDEAQESFNLKLGLGLFLILTVYNMNVLVPWRSYDWDDQNVAEFKSYLKTIPSKELVVCSNAFQLEYYFNRPYETCTGAALRFHFKKQDFYLFDLTGNDKLLMLFLSNEAHIENYQKFNHAVFLSVTYPKSK